MSTITALASDGLMATGVHHLNNPLQNICCFMTGLEDSPKLCDVHFVNPATPTLRAKLTEVQAIVTATIDVAQYCGSGAKIGTIHFLDGSLNLGVLPSDMITRFTPLNSTLSVVHFDQRCPIAPVILKTADVQALFTDNGYTVP